MSSGPVIPLRVTHGKPPAEALAALDRRWLPRYLLLAPHRLAFFLAMVVLAVSAVWWALVQADRVSTLVGLTFAMAPTLVHAAVMVFGFVPLFFCGFLFTAGPKWLGVEPPPTPRLIVPLLAQAGGWLLWLIGSHMSTWPGVAGLVLAGSGLARITWLFWQLIGISPVQDRLHARTIGTAFVVGCISVLGLLAGVVLQVPWVARASVLTGLWGFSLVVYVTVAHRMIPFFTSSAMPFINARRPFWALGLMLAIAAFEVLAVWVESGGFLRAAWAGPWALVRGVTELVCGGVLLWLSVVWGLMQSLKNRLLAMLHIGFLWLGLALVLGGVTQLLGWLQGSAVLSLGALHALTMGCLASLMLAMVTRVSCGHAGRALVADRIVWSLFLLLQAATLMRIAAAIHPALANWLLLPAAVLWAITVGVWGARLVGWYGRVRADGRAG